MRISDWSSDVCSSDLWKGHFGAAVVAFLAIGLHQLQFHPLFAAGFLFWIVLQRRWGLAAFYAVVYALIILFWGKVYPAILHDVYQVKPLAGGKPSNLALRSEERRVGKEGVRTC